MRHLKSLAILSQTIAGAACAGLLTIGVPAFADGEDDSNADAASFVDVMNGAHGVIVAVPVNAAGEENTDAAVLMAYTGPESVIADGAFDKALAASVEIGSRPEVLDPDSDSNTDGSGDSSTWWGHHWNRGWRHAGYYYNYRPYYSYGSYSWNCGYPYYGSYYGNYGNYYSGYGYSNYNTYYYPYIY